MLLIPLSVICSWSANCSWSFVHCVIILSVFCYLICIVLLCVCIVVLHTLDAGLPA